MADIPSFSTIISDVYEIRHRKKYKTALRLTKAVLEKHKINDVSYKPYFAIDVDYQADLIEHLVHTATFWLSHAGLFYETKDDVNFESLSFIKDTSAYFPILINNLNHYIGIDDYSIDKTIQNINYEFNEYAKHLPNDKLLNEWKNDLLSLLHYDVAKTSDSIKMQQDIALTETKQVNGSNANNVEVELLQRLKSLNPTAFEHFALHLIGSIVRDKNDSLDDLITHNGQVGDGGIDGVVKVKRLLGGYDSYFMQCKRYDTSVIGRPELQSFVGSMVYHSITTGIFITTSKFSKQALEYIENIKGYQIDLIDGKQLVQYMIEHDIGVKSIAIQAIDDDFFSKFD